MSPNYHVEFLSAEPKDLAGEIEACLNRYGGHLLDRIVLLPYRGGGEAGQERVLVIMRRFGYHDGIPIGA